MKTVAQKTNLKDQGTKSIEVLRELVKNLVITKDISDKKIYRENLIKYLRKNY